jgi:hypothetical protein
MNRNLEIEMKGVLDSDVFQPHQGRDQELGIGRSGFKGQGECIPDGWMAYIRPRKRTQGSNTNMIAKDEIPEYEPCVHEIISPPQ